MLEKIIQQNVREIHFTLFCTNARTDFNFLIDGKGFFDLPVKMKKKPTKKLCIWAIIMTKQLEIY